MTVSSSSRTPEICARRMSRMPQRANRTADTARPAKPQPPKQPKELPQLLAGDKARPQKAAGKEKGQLGYAQLFHKTTPLFNLSHYIIFLSP